MTKDDTLGGRRVRAEPDRKNEQKSTKSTERKREEEKRGGRKKERREGNTEFATSRSDLFCTVMYDPTPHSNP